MDQRQFREWFANVEAVEADGKRRADFHAIAADSGVSPEEADAILAAWKHGNRPFEIHTLSEKLVKRAIDTVIVGPLPRS